MTNAATFQKSDSSERGRIVLINTRKDNNKLAMGSSVAKLEVIDPAEGARRRAVAEVHDKERESTAAGHSTSGKQKRNTSPTPQTKKKKAVKKSGTNHTGDIFDD
jgi:hypothetical protein